MAAPERFAQPPDSPLAPRAPSIHDPIDSGLVPSLNRPGGNMTGIFNLVVPLVAKRLELLHELMPNVSVVTFLANPTNAPFTEHETTEVRNAARSLGLQLNVLNARTTEEIDTAFATFAQVRTGALLISADAFFISRREQIVALAARYALPTIYPTSECTTDGGLISYAFNRCRDISPDRHLRWPHSQGREAGRPAGPTGHKSGAGRQPEDCQGA